MKVQLVVLIASPPRKSEEHIEIILKCITKTIPQGAAVVGLAGPLYNRALQ